MERNSISLDDDLLAEFDRFIEGKGYRNRSEAVRDLLRQRLDAERTAPAASGQAAGCLAYVYNSNNREVAQRLTQAQHDHNSVILSCIHVPLDRDDRFEVVVLQGPAAEVRAFADRSLARTGVRHGHLHLVPV